MHEHLRDIGSMRLIFELRPDHLSGAYDGTRPLLGHQHHALATCRARRGAAPERLRLAPGQRWHEAYGRAALHAVPEYIAQPLDLPIARGLEASNPQPARAVHVQIFFSRPNSLPSIFPSPPAFSFSMPDLIKSPRGASVSLDQRVHTSGLDGVENHQQTVPILEELHGGRGSAVHETKLVDHGELSGSSA